MLPGTVYRTLGPCSWLVFSKSQAVQNLNMIFIRAWYPQSDPPVAALPDAPNDVDGVEEDWLFFLPFTHVLVQYVQSQRDDLFLTCWLLRGTGKPITTWG